MESAGVPSTSTESMTGANISSGDSSSFPIWWPYMSLYPTPVIEPLELHLSPEENMHGLSTTMIEKRWRIFFRLLKRSEPLHCYIFEMHEELHLSPEENMHGLSTTMIEKRWRIFFRLLKRSEPLHCYIFEMHESGANIPSRDSSSFPIWLPYMSLYPTPVIEPLELHLSPEENTHGLSTTMIEKRWRIFFRLLQCSEPLHCYILEMHEVERGKITRYQSTIHLHEVTTTIVAMSEHITTMPMVLIFNHVRLQRRSMLTLHKRLGNWIME
ncbi:uncharacterized protein LOC127266667 [Andrographis paniculata]|uniref:uncharacterized protein LOC127266667 n=1 Tax=Andrographis paniculata TaxID=175694 RepID=UPI0021E7DDD7|nr:uncharacterized protein LOC127266667 [Andrographis paniculata]